MFTANAAVVLDRKALLARFRHHERQKEEFYFETTFRALQQRGLIESIESCLIRCARRRRRLCVGCMA